MKYIRNFIAVGLALFYLSGCQKEQFDDTSFAQKSATPDNLSMSFEITNDNSGKVNILPNGNGISKYEIAFGDETSSTVYINPGSQVTHNYKEGNYTVKLIGHSLSGQTTEITKSLNITYRAPENVEVTTAIDPENNLRVIVSAKALYESGFEVYFGDIMNETPKLIQEGQSISHDYEKTGTYTVRIVALSGGKAKTEMTQTVTISSPLIVPVDFESTSINYSFFDFDGGTSTRVDNPHPAGINTSAKVGRMIKKPGQPWGGSILLLDAPIDFSKGKKFKVKVWSPRVGGKLLLKVENRSNSGINFEREASTTVANAWQELTFDYSDINTTNSYHNIVLIFDLGTPGDGSANFTYYFDDIILTN